MQTTYYVLSVEDPDVGYRARLNYTRDYPLRSWMTGKAFDKQPPLPIIVKLRGTDEDDWTLGDLWLTPITVMSKRLYETLVQAGVATMDTYPVELHDPVNGTLHENFIAFNITCKLSAADASNTTFAPENTDTLISADIDSLAIDANKASDALLFRLAESVNTIIVHESIKQAIEAAGIDTLTFIKPEDWAS